MTLPEITAAIKGLTVAKDIIKGFTQLKTETEIMNATIELKGTIIEIQNHLLSIQSSYQSMLDSKKNVEDELKKLKDWETEKLNYFLKEIASGVFVYVMKESQDTSQSKHWLCANCFDGSNKKSILQKKYVDYSDFFCPSCKTNFKLPDQGKGYTPIRFGV